MEFACNYPFALAPAAAPKSEPPALHEDTAHRPVYRFADTSPGSAENTRPGRSLDDLMGHSITYRARHNASYTRAENGLAKSTSRVR